MVSKRKLTAIAIGTLTLVFLMTIVFIARVSITISDEEIPLNNSLFYKASFYISESDEGPFRKVGIGYISQKPTLKGLSGEAVKGIIVDSPNRSVFLRADEEVDWCYAFSALGKYYVRGIIREKISTVDGRSTVERLRISGNHFVSDSNSEKVLKGLCCASSTRINRNWRTWYNSTSIENIVGWGVNIFRITIRPDQFENNPQIVDDLAYYIDLCIDNNMYVLISWMGNEDYLQHEEAAKAFFDAMSNKYANVANIMYEICNEPFHASWKDLKRYGNTIIPIIRANSPDSIVMVPAPYTIIKGDDSMLSIIGDELEFDNVAYTQHMYVGSSLQSSTLLNIQKLIDNNIMLFVSEWGTTDSDNCKAFYEDNSNVFLHFMEDRHMNWINFQLSDVFWDNTPYASSIVRMGEWDNSLDDSILSESGFYIKHFFLGDNNSYNSYGNVAALGEEQQVHDCVMMSYYDGYGFWTDAYRNSISEVYFCADNSIPSDYLDSWDYSMNTGSGDVVAYLVDDAGKQKLYIVAKYGDVIAPAKMDYFFNDFKSLKSVDFEYLNTSNVSRTQKLFAKCSVLDNVRFCHNNFSNLKNCSQMFDSCSSMRYLDMSSLNFGNVENINMMFSWCINLNYLYLPYLNPDNIVASSSVFANFAINEVDIKCSTYEMLILVEDCLSSSDNNNDSHSISTYDGISRQKTGSSAEVSEISEEIISSDNSEIHVDDAEGQSGDNNLGEYSEEEVLTEDN